jgi:hypothetical protein
VVCEADGLGLSDSCEWSRRFLPSGFAMTY